jgi:hypothetical protein
MDLYRSMHCQALLEEWPSTNPSNNQKKKKKKVSIATHSEQRVFRNTSHRSVKSYSSYDFDLFKDEASRDARKIFDLISKFPVPTGSAVQSVLGLGLLQQEELVGLEHLITPRVVLDHIKGRKSHVALIMRAQKILRERGVSEDVFHSKLAMVAKSSSSRHVEKAKLKAKMSLQAEKVHSRSCVRGRRSRSRIDPLSASFTSKLSISSSDKEPQADVHHENDKKKHAESRTSGTRSTSNSESTLSLSAKTHASSLPSVLLPRGLNFAKKAKRTAAHAA